MRWDCSSLEDVPGTASDPTLPMLAVYGVEEGKREGEEKRGRAIMRCANRA